MKRYNIVASLLLTFAVYSTSLLYAQERAAPIVEIKRSKIPLGQFLGEVGKTYGCFFTVETAWNESEPLNQEEALLVDKPLTKTNLKQEIERLLQQIPNFTYVVNQNDPQII